MKIGTIITGIILLIAISAIPVMADPDCSIYPGQNEVKFSFQTFVSGDHWDIEIISDMSQTTLKYDLNSNDYGKISGGEDWYVWLSNKDQTQTNGIRLCVQDGDYYAVATGYHGTDSYRDNKSISIKSVDLIGCNGIIPAVPELSPFILTSAGILGLVLISRRYKK